MCRCLLLKWSVLSRHASALDSGFVRECNALWNTCCIAQAYQLLRMDMLCEEVELAAAAPPGLLDAASALWAHKAEVQRKVCTACCRPPPPPPPPPPRPDCVSVAAPAVPCPATRQAGVLAPPHTG